MISGTNGSLVEQRHALRLRLQAQRQVIARQLGPASGLNGHFPRSMTMRFLIRRPELATSLLMGFASLLKAR